MTLSLFIPRDAAALSVGAGRVADAVMAEAAILGVPVALKRTGSRGMLWLEPLVEVERDGVRHAYGPVTPVDVPGLMRALAEGREHPLALGPVEALAWMPRQQRLTFGRCGAIDPLSLADYSAHGGWRGLRAALAMEPQAVVDAVKASGLRGRGGAGFPTGIKWNTVLNAAGDKKYVVCNADEGDSGTFADRMIMEGDPFLLIEGMIIAGLAVGATKGFVYIRSEYPHAVRTMRAAVDLAYGAGFLGDDVDGSRRSFDMEIRLGAGAYICGEETSLLESLEGRRGQVRAKPPLPALQGLFGKPTIVNNVLSLAAVPWILEHGGPAYADYGMGRSRGTLPVQIAGNVKRGGLFETAFGLTLREIIEDLAGGTASGRPVRAVQVGGPLGAYLPAHLLDTPLDYEALAAAGGMLGHGGLVVFDDTVDMARQAASPWSSARWKAAASARRAASVRRAASR